METIWASTSDFYHMPALPPPFQTEESKLFHPSSQDRTPRHLSTLVLFFRLVDLVGDTEVKNSLSGFSQLYIPSTIIVLQSKTLVIITEQFGWLFFISPQFLDFSLNLLCVYQSVDISWTFKSVLCEFHQFLRLILTSQGFLLIFSFYSSSLSSLGKYVFQPLLFLPLFPEGINEYLYTFFVSLPSSYLLLSPATANIFPEVNWITHCIQLSLTDIQVHIPSSLL